MPSPIDITRIPSPRASLIDQRTGEISREWYRFLLNLFQLAGGGVNPTSLEDIQKAPLPQDNSLIVIDPYGPDLNPVSPIVSSEIISAIQDVSLSVLSKEDISNLIFQAIQDVSVSVLSKEDMSSEINSALQEISLSVLSKEDTTGVLLQAIQDVSVSVLPVLSMVAGVPAAISWTPTWTGGTLTVNYATYVLSGNLITVEMSITFGASLSVATGYISIPFVGLSAATGGSIGYYSAIVNAYLFLEPSSSRFSIRTGSNGALAINTSLALSTLNCSFTYSI